MILKVMGLMDLICAVALVLVPFDLIGWKLIIFLAGYLLLKSCAFSEDYASVIDGVSGIYLLLAYFGISTMLAPIFSLYLLQKALFSL